MKFAKTSANVAAGGSPGGEGAAAAPGRQPGVLPDAGEIRLAVGGPRGWRLQIHRPSGVRGTFDRDARATALRQCRHEQTHGDRDRPYTTSLHGGIVTPRQAFVRPVRKDGPYTSARGVSLKK